MNLTNLFTTDYLFETLPQTDFLFGFPLIFYFLGLLFCKSIIKNCFYKNKHAKKTLKKKIRKYPFFGAVGLLFVLVRFAEIETFSMRIFLFSVVVISFAFLIKDIVKSCKEYRARLASAERERSK